MRTKRKLLKRRKKRNQNPNCYYPFPFFIWILKGFQLTQPWWGLDATLNKLSKYINFIKFGLGMIPQLIVLQNVLLIGIFMPLIKIQTKYFKNPKEMLCWACISHKLSNHISFIKFGNVFCSNELNYKLSHNRHYIAFN